MKKITGLLAILLVAIMTITACGGKKSDTKKSSATSKSKVSQTVSKSSQSSTSSQVLESSSSSVVASASESEHVHGEAEESQWSQQSSEAAKVMTVSEARQTLRELNINDGNFSNADINKYILEAQAAGQEFGAYMVAQGFEALK
ncbi:hypothetical protein [Pseudolactococcus reticulitermitis]|uniref:Lipoprotein n=1 Tax=Pseudolactococcus reticulitermitis TaxID=2025039 RepID=A0A224X1A5_9LACT|nr:hypothetical protein [Lactococcus reticulitermitis]GAX47978.1 hypothetical protein RsY01_1592 [Lactococcus reticulitermitis]